MSPKGERAVNCGAVTISGFEYFSRRASQDDGQKAGSMGFETSSSRILPGVQIGTRGTAQHRESGAWLPLLSDGGIL